MLLVNVLLPAVAPLHTCIVMSEVDAQALYIHRKHVGLKHIYSEAPGMRVESHRSACFCLGGSRDPFHNLLVSSGRGELDCRECKRYLVVRT